MILFIITIVVAVTKGEAGLPEVFSPSHHSTAGRAFVDSFAPTSPALTTVAQEAIVCELSQSDAIRKTQAAIGKPFTIVGCIGARHLLQLKMQLLMPLSAP